MVFNKSGASFKANSNSIIFYSILLVYGLIFSSISLVNHYFFRTSAYDLGINNNALYDYAHFRVNDCMIMWPQYENVLSDHFSLYPILVSPFSWVLGSYTVLIFQLLSILFGGVGIYKLIIDKSKKEALALTAMCHFFSMWGIYSALSFDYHDNVVAAMLVPWLMVFFFRKSWTPFFLFFIFILISKENMALWMGFICLGLCILSYKDRASFFIALLGSVLAFIYFILIVKVVIPALANPGADYKHFHYAALGANFEEAFINIFTKPTRIFELFLVNHTGDPDYDTIKAELYLTVLLSGGYAFFRKPSFFIMLIPIFAQKMLNDDMGKWGVNGHYSIEFVPIVTIALYWWLSESKYRHVHILAIMALLICLLKTYTLFESRYSRWYSSELVRFYDKEHYQTVLPVSEIHEQLGLIPEEASVSASSHLVPHLCFREYIYEYPLGDQSDYIILLDEENTYPLRREDLKNRIADLLRSRERTTIYAKDGFFIFKKNKH